MHMVSFSFVKVLVCEQLSESVGLGRVLQIREMFVLYSLYLKAQFFNSYRDRFFVRLFKPRKFWQSQIKVNVNYPFLARERLSSCLFHQK